MRAKRLLLVLGLIVSALAVGLLVFLALLLIDIPVAGRDDIAAFRAYLDREVPAAMAEFDVGASVVGLVHQGRIVHLAGYGFADAARRVPATPDTVFQVASVSKTFTAWGVMRLVREGRIALDSPVNAYLKRWHLPASDYDADMVTVRRLLSHTAGIANVGGGYAGYGPGEPVQTLVESLQAATDANGESVRIVAEPGQVHDYSGGGYTILQLMIEDVTGQSFSDYMQDHVLGPLGMDSSGFDLTEALRARLPVVFGLDGQIAPTRIFTAKAAAGLYTTGRDLSGWLAASLSLLSGASDTPVLDAPTLAAMITPQPEADGLLADGLGYGIAGKLLGGAPEIFHTGRSPPGWIALVSLFPQSGDGLVILSNAPGGMALEHRIRSAWMTWATGDAGTFGLRLQKLVNMVKAIVPIGVFGEL